MDIEPLEKLHDAEANCSMTTREDVEDMILRVAAGERLALSELYTATSAKLFGVCIRILGRDGEAEDALQEVFVKIWRNADRYAANGLSPMTWLITIARNHSIDRVRARGVRQGTGLEEAEDLATDQPGPEAMAMAASDRARIVACFGELKPDRAEAVRRVYLEGDSYADLSAHFNVPLNTMRTWLRRGLIALRECLSR